MQLESRVRLLKRKRERANGSHESRRRRRELHAPESDLSWSKRSRPLRTRITKLRGRLVILLADVEAEGSAGCCRRECINRCWSANLGRLFRRDFSFKAASPPPAQKRLVRFDTTSRSAIRPNSGHSIGSRTSPKPAARFSSGLASAPACWRLAVKGAAHYEGLQSAGRLHP
jgi:hypothetical protein